MKKRPSFKAFKRTALKNKAFKKAFKKEYEFLRPEFELL